MREMQTHVGVDLKPRPEEKNDYKCWWCAFMGSRQERYDHEQTCLPHLQEMVRQQVKAEKTAARTTGR